MTYVALTLAGGLAVVVVAFAGLLRSILRQQARERDLLLNQIMHLSGRTWTPPPAAANGDEKHEPDQFTATPELDGLNF
jgi:hypothetical protein